MEDITTSPISVPDSKLPRIIVIGGGFGGIKLIKALKNAPYQIVLFDRNNYHTFQPLLYQVATAGLEPDSIADPLRKQLEKMKNFYFRMGEVYSINTSEKKINSEIGYLEYDHLVIATGSKTNYFGNQSIVQKAFPLKQIPQALDLRSHILQTFEASTITTNKAELEAQMNLVIVGGGPTGVEVAGALGELKKSILPVDYPELDFEQMTIVLIEGTPKLLNGMSDQASQKALRYLRKFGVEVKLNTLVKTYENELVQLNDGSAIPTKTLIWAAGVKGNYPQGLQEECLENDRILVNQFNQVVGYKDIWAIGDIAKMKSDENPGGHPMLAPVAIQQGKRLATNFKRLSKAKPLIKFEYKDKGSMATVGRNKAVVNIGRLTVGGLVAWFIWMFIHLISIIGFRNKLIVFMNWVWNYFTYDKGTRLIIRRFDPNKKRQE